MSARLCVLGALHRGAAASAGDFALLGGGKGANQAVAASRLGARVALVGAVGEDEWGRTLRGALACEGIDLVHVSSAPAGELEGVATLTVEDVDRAASAIAAADVLLVQGELPPAVTQHAMRIARQANTLVLYDAAPARPLPDGFLQQVNVLVASPGDAAELLADTTGEIGPPGLVRRLASLGPQRVVLRLRSEGAFHFDGERLMHVEGFPAPSAPSAPTSDGAADAFAAALGVLRGEGARFKDAVRFACAAGTLATSPSGMLASFPARETVEALARRRKGARTI